MWWTAYVTAPWLFGLWFCCLISVRLSGYRHSMFACAPPFVHVTLYLTAIAYLPSYRAIRDTPWRLLRMLSLC